MLNKVLGLSPAHALSWAIDILYDGKHTGASASAILIDNTERRKQHPFNADIIGKVLYNLRDGSQTIITAQSNREVTGVLAGGTDDDWTDGDEYIIGSPSLNVQRLPYTSMRSGIKNVTTAGTAERLVDAVTPCKMVMIQNNSDQNDPSCIGDSNVVAAEATQRGIIIATDSAKNDPSPLILYIDDLYKVYVDVRVDGNGVTFLYFN